MATNSGHGYRHGAERNRSQNFNPNTGHWTKRDSRTGQFLNTKADGAPFNGVRREH